jgi:hypothetical protein
MAVAAVTTTTTTTARRMKFSTNGAIAAVAAPWSNNTPALLHFALPQGTHQHEADGVVVATVVNHKS